MERRVVSFPLKRVYAIDELANVDGSRNLGFHFFVYRDDDVMCDMHTISEATDPGWLLEMIGRGKVFVWFDLNG